MTGQQMNVSGGIHIVTPKGRSKPMGQTSDKPRILNPFQVLRGVRDAGMGSWARIMLTITSSSAYSRASSVLAKPGLVVTAVVRRRTDAAMSQILSRINMPSRTDVLSLSVRLSHIEMALDDLGAAMDDMRAAAARSPSSAKRASASTNAPRPTAAREG
jgi:hypothetical protein